MKINYVESEINDVYIILVPSCPNIIVNKIFLIISNLSGKVVALCEPFALHAYMCACMKESHTVKTLLVCLRYAVGSSERDGMYK